jgi:hypothetical protein
VHIDTRYENAYIFGAFRHTRDCAVGLILFRADIAMMQLHPNQISAALPPQVHAAMITDDARWHLAQALRIPDNITLIDIPLATYEDILDACQQAWNALLAESGRIASLTSMQHLLAVYVG